MIISRKNAHVLWTNRLAFGQIGFFHSRVPESRIWITAQIPKFLQTNMCINDIFWRGACLQKFNTVYGPRSGSTIPDPDSYRDLVIFTSSPRRRCVLYLCRGVCVLSSDLQLYYFSKISEHIRRGQQHYKTIIII